MKGKTFNCSDCGYNNDKKFAVQRHIKKVCSTATIEEISVDITCTHCGREYTTRPVLQQHLKSCKVLKEDRESQQAQEIEDLKRQLEEAKSRPQTVNYNVNVNNLIINGYRQTSFEHLTDKHYQRAVHRMVNMVPQMIQDVHFNTKAPENHNIYISNIKNKYAMVYDGEKWCSKPQDQVITDLINDQEYAIEEWLGEGDNFPKEMKKFNQYLDRKENGINGFKSEEIKEQIREEVKLLLYNNRTKINRK